MYMLISSKVEAPGRIAPAVTFEVVLVVISEFLFSPLSLRYLLSLSLYLSPHLSPDLCLSFLQVGTFIWIQYKYHYVRANFTEYYKIYMTRINATWMVYCRIWIYQICFHIWIAFFWLCPIRQM